MGGHAAGDMASTTVIDAVRAFDLAESDPNRLTMILNAGVRAANEQLADKVRANPDLGGMGSTLAAMLWSGTHVAIANLGDSRVYRLRDGAFRRLTEDHVVGNLVHDPMPAEIGDYLVRFLDARPGWSPDLTLHVARPGDWYLICSDGLSGFVNAEAIREAVVGAADPDQAVSDLIRLAHEAGAPDNVTVIAMDLRDGTWEERDESPILLGAAASLAGTT